MRRRETDVERAREGERRRKEESEKARMFQRLKLCPKVRRKVGNGGRQKQKARTESKARKARREESRNPRTASNPPPPRLTAAAPELQYS